MKLFTLIFMAVALILFAGCAGEAAAQEDTFVFGEGRFEIEGRKPKVFADFKELYLEGATLKAAPGRRLLPQPPGTVRGALQTRRKFRLKNARFEGEYLTFETAAVGGVSYRFEGKVSNYRDDDAGILIPQFRGKLSKWTAGKKSAEAQIILVWMEPEF